MYFSYFDTEITDETQLAREVKKLKNYRAHCAEVIGDHDTSQPEYSLAHVGDPTLHKTIASIGAQFKGVKHVVVVGIGGSNLGTEAIHEVLDEGKVTLHALDTIASYQIDRLLEKLKSVKKVNQLAICVISKSGGTAETLVNAGVLLDALETRFGKEIYPQAVFIGNAGTDFMKAGKRLGVTCVAMPNIVGGRYSVGTEVGLIPLALLGHDTDSIMAGMLDASGEEFETITAENAARLAIYATKKHQHYNFFAFEPRLYKLGAWYRQLQAESLGKATTRSGKEMTKGYVPTISTAVELHSVGQLYLSGFAGVYTDFVTFDDQTNNHAIPKKGIAKAYGKFDMQEVATAIYGGVIAAYQEQGLPHRATIFTEDLGYSLGVFMGMRMQEVMYAAELLDVNAFDQPSVELYKDKTREILKL